MELVPFLDKWTGSESKLDLKAIYRRPDSRGITLTNALPLRRHKDWASKGFAYVSLATMKDLGEVANELRSHGYDPLPMRASFDKDGLFNVPAYLNQAKQDDATFLAALQAKVDKLGPDVVVEMMRMTDPMFELPAGITLPEPTSAAPVDPKGRGGK